MDVELLIHGVPEGQDYYGIEDERTNAGLFYDNSTEVVKYVVETKQFHNKNYAYYSYLRYKNIVGAKGRSGSYFGMTLRTDMLYQDGMHIYTLLDIVFKRHVIGTLLLPIENGGFKYVDVSFFSKKSEIEQFTQCLIQLIQGTCVSTRFLNIDNSYVHPITTVVPYNISEIDDSILLSSLKKYSKVVISPDYPLSIANEYEKKLRESESKVGIVAAEKDNKINALNVTISQQKTRISDMQREVDQMKREVSQYRQRGDLNQIVEKIKDPILMLAKYYNVNDSQKQQQRPRYALKNFIVGVLNALLLIVVIILLIILLVREPITDKNNGTQNITTESTAVTTSATSTTTETPVVASSTTETSTVITETSDVTASTTGTQAPQTKQLRIDIVDYSGGPLIVDKEYTIKIMEGKNIYNSGSGNWTLTNADLTNGTNTSSQIKIKPNGKGNVILKYVSQGCECTARTINIQKSTTSETTTPTTAPTTSKNTADVDFNISITPNVTEVVVGELYTFRITGLTTNGTWSVDGFEQPTDKSAAEINVKAIDRGGKEKAIISYTPAGYPDKKKTRSFTLRKGQ